MIKILCNSLVAIVIVTFASQYLINIVKLEARISRIQKCQQDKLLIRQMLILDYKRAASKEFVRIPNGLRIDDTAYHVDKSTLGKWEFYRYAANNPRPSWQEIISREVKQVKFEEKSIQIIFNSPECTALVINCVIQNIRQ